ncbi:unnamed protein product [Didymodactylos carnosus]|uniref:Tc1-like transposase DDE domain-containing protein n=1 Tax=Didymodactylos carnosus TaxID=1234261 RepID=A0A8S2YC44_9BILA|nr:unnamed protein product [Didymodactylos carnosus]
MHSAASTLRAEHGPNAKIVICVDNATWHNKLTPESEAPKRAWRKQKVTDWLNLKKLKFDSYMTKAELLDTAYKNLPPKEYMADKAAERFGIEIVRIPVKHCVLNPIELVWSGLKNYVRSQNIRFSLNDVEQLSLEWLSSVGPEHVRSYYEHMLKHEEIFRAADKIAEELETDLIDDDDVDDTLIEADSSDDE